MADAKTEKTEKSEEKVEKPKKTIKEKRPEKEKQRMKVVVRVLGADLDGEKGVAHAILRIRGVSYAFANAICKATKLDPNKKLGSFTESELAGLERAVKNPSEFGIPVWLLNRRRDIESNVDFHVSGTDVDVTRKFDVQRMVDTKTYKGVRHMLGLPVRGQRTRSSFRGGGTVGVVRKSVRLATGATAAPAPAAEAKKAEKKESPK